MPPSSLTRAGSCRILAILTSTLLAAVRPDGDDILVSTMAERAKARAVKRNQKVSLCVLTETWPFTYLQVYGDAKVETDHDANVDLAMRIAGVMAGEPMPEGPKIADGVRREGR